MRTIQLGGLPDAQHRRLLPAPVLAVIVCAMLTVAQGAAQAGPTVAAGDALLRHDLQVLADHGILTGTITTWPLAWGPLLEGLEQSREQLLTPAVEAAVGRIRQRARWETRRDALRFSAQASVAPDPRRIRGFQDTPRDESTLGAGVAWTGDRMTVTLQGQVVEAEDGVAEGWMDGSEIGIALGNWALSLNTLNRWWGPGWDGSTILSNNSRPIPAVTLGRNFTDPFESRWLAWLGSWDLTLVSGQLESDRHVPEALFFGARFNFRPLRSLEIGLSRTAQWCGEGRPCNAEAFFDLLAGQDNIESAGLAESGEPGNQMAGMDFRWSLRAFGFPVAIYGQVTGEDEAGGFPSRYIGQFGVESSGIFRNEWSWRWFGEFAGTSCQFHESSKRFNCAYNHGTYRTGYRYRGRPIGHGADNDAEVFSSGLLVADRAGNQLDLLVRTGTLNKGGQPDSRNTLTPTPLDIDSADLRIRHAFRYGMIEASVGFERTDAAEGTSDSDVHYYLMWRSAY